MEAARIRGSRGLFLTPPFNLLFFVSRAIDVIGTAAARYRKEGMKAMLFQLTSDDHIRRQSTAGHACALMPTSPQFVACRHVRSACKYSSFRGVLCAAEQTLLGVLCRDRGERILQVHIVSTACQGTNIAQIISSISLDGLYLDLVIADSTNRMSEGKKGPKSTTCASVLELHQTRASVRHRSFLSTRLAEESEQDS